MARAALAQHEGRFDDAMRIGADALAMAARGNHQAADFTYRILVSSCRLKTSGGPVEPGFGFIHSGPDVFHVFPAMLAAEAGDLETAAALFALALPVDGRPQRERSPGPDPRRVRRGRLGAGSARCRPRDLFGP